MIMQRKDAILNMDRMLCHYHMTVVNVLNSLYTIYMYTNLGKTEYKTIKLRVKYISYYFNQ